MNRRHFLKGAAACSTLGMIRAVQASVMPAPAHRQHVVDGDNTRRRFRMTQTYDIRPPQGSQGNVSLWIPIPAETSFQHVHQLTYSGNYQQATLNTNNSYGAKTLFVSWPDSRQPMTIKVVMLVETQDWEPLKNHALAGWDLPEKAGPIPLEVMPYLEPTAHIPVSGLVKDTARHILQGETVPLKQARLLHNWVSTHMRRDNQTIGCGQGNVGEILKTGRLSGKCTDINSVFVALCRAVGIPAREMFGIRLGATRKLNQYSTAFGSADGKGVAHESGGQHCRAEFWLAGYGWLPADPADVTKMRLAEQKHNDDPAVQAVNEYLFGNWEMNWMVFNHARDVTLFPTPEQGALNHFGYPYAEVDGDPLNFYDPNEFRYDYVSVEQV